MCNFLFSIRRKRLSSATLKTNNVNAVIIGQQVNQSETRTGNNRIEEAFFQIKAGFRAANMGPTIIANGTAFMFVFLQQTDLSQL